MRIERVTIENFRGFEAFEFNLHPRLTALVGRNGAGKSAALDAIIFALHRLKVQPRDFHRGASEIKVTLHTTENGRPNLISTIALYDDRDRIHQEDQWTGKGSLVTAYGVERHVADLTPGSTPGRAWTYAECQASWAHAALDYQTFFEWFREMEDLENERLRYQKDGKLDPSLEAVRQALTALFPELGPPRVYRQMPRASTKPVLGVTKGDTVLPLDALSEGERNTLVMFADMARRMAIYSESDHPLEEEAIVLIDEIEQHMHPAWQRRILTKMLDIFPNTQFIVTTHSPVVVSELRPENLRILKDFKLLDVHHSPGRDANAILEDTFQTTSRNPEIQNELDRLADLLDDRDLEAAGKALETLRTELGAAEPDIVYYGNIYAMLTDTKE